MPGRVAVIGFDDIEDGRFCIPTLTTVAPDKERIARLAVELLAGRLGRRPGRAAPGTHRPPPPGRPREHHRSSLTGRRPARLTFAGPRVERAGQAGQSKKRARWARRGGWVVRGAAG